MMLDPSVSNMWETGSYKQRNGEVGSMAFAAEDPIIRPCFAMEIRGLGKPTSRKKAYPPRSQGIAKEM